jgi:hypothetical protein
MGILGTLSLIPGFAYILALFVIGALVLPDRLKAAAADRIPATVGFHEIKDGGETRAKLSRAGVTRILPAELGCPLRTGTWPVQLQADWATAGRGGEKLALGWSRAAYVEFCVARADALLKQFLLSGALGGAGE